MDTSLTQSKAQKKSVWRFLDSIVALQHDEAESCIAHLRDCLSNRLESKSQGPNNRTLQQG